MKENEEIETLEETQIHTVKSRNQADCDHSDGVHLVYQKLNYIQQRKQALAVLGGRSL